MDNGTNNKDEILSFLQGRDPSIITANRPITVNAKAALQFESIGEESSVELGNNIKIYLRIKQAENIQDLYKINENEIKCYIPAASTGSKNIKNVETVIKTYQFSYVFDTNSTQEEIFDCIVKHKVLKFINGENFTLMSYGASGSGKTFTMVGTTTEPGIIPRTLEYVFKTMPELPRMPFLRPTQSGEVEILENVSSQQEANMRKELLKLASNTIGEQHMNTYKEMQERLSTEPAGILDDQSDVIVGVWVSFAEIYNEQIYDLLTAKSHLKATARPKLQLGACNENTYIKNLTNISVSSGIEAYQILQYGIHNLNYASTTINKHSSRSHCIFTIKIVQMIKATNITRLNYFNFCDLAGSERLKKTLNVGDRLVESNNINTSLLVLGKCFTCIRDSQKKNVNKLIPFRESKLTRLFQKAFTGYETISMIVNMNPSFKMLEESQHVLNFSAMAKEISVKLVPIIPKKKNRFSEYLAAKTADDETNIQKTDESEIDRLQNLIDELYTELEGLSKYHNEQEQNIREEMTKEYTNIIEDIKQYHKKVLKRQEARHMEDLQLLNAKYMYEKCNDEVICLDSSTDEDENCNQENPVNAELEEVKKQISDLNMELAEKDQIIDELRRTIEDADSYCNDIKNAYDGKMNNVINENLMLKEKNYELEILVEEYGNVLGNSHELIMM